MTSERNPAGREQPCPAGTDRLLNRRRFMEGAAWLGAVAGLEISFGGMASAATRGKEHDSALDTRLPDGAEFSLWEQPLTFSRTYYVDNTSGSANDTGPGDKARPFRTIGKAAEILQPGERVVIAAGTYRECIRPARGGTGPSQMISYEAAPGAKVYVKGSEVLKGGWKQEALLPGPRDVGGASVAVWSYRFSPELFPELYNPFALPSIMASWGWLDPTVADMGPYLRRRGLVFVDGRPLEPVEQLNDLAMPDLPPVPDFTRPPAPQRGMPPRRRPGPVMQEIGGSPDARFWVNRDGTAIYVRLPAGTPADHLVEVTTRAAAFVPNVGGASYIRVKGLIFQHAGNAYPYPAGQEGMVSLAGGDHWIVEDNIIEWANGAGLIVGRDAFSGTTASNPGKAQVLRRNTIRFCGVTGLSGMGTTDTLIEDNLIEWCGWADAERGWEAGAAKFHRAKNMMFRRNVIRHIRHSVGAWWDVDNVNCRITRNVLADILTVGSAIHMEMNSDQNQIDNNIIWDVRNAEPGTPGQRGCAGSGIFDNATDKLTITHNLVGRCDNAGIFPIIRQDRGAGTGTGNIVSNNIFAKCEKAGIIFLNRNNKADGNVYVNMPWSFQGLFEGVVPPTYDPLAWQHIKYRTIGEWQALGWDKTSVMLDAQVDFDPKTLRLTFFARKPLPPASAVAGNQSDLLGRPTSARRVAGPMADLHSKSSWNADPRLL